MPLRWLREGQFGLYFRAGGKVSVFGAETKLEGIPGDMDQEGGGTAFEAQGKPAVRKPYGASIGKTL
jgi:hypothetical protein